jgi:glutathione S-transferase
MSSNDAVNITGFASVPEFARGLVRDLRVRWALEEAGVAYQAKLLAQGEQKGPENLRVQPFGQVPAFGEGRIEMFETGAIVLHIGENCETLLPKDPAARARATSWVFAALNSVEPYLTQIAAIDIFHAGEAWTRERRPQVEASARERLGLLADWLGDRDYLEDEFTAGDLMMTTVLRILRHTTLVTERPLLAAYQARCEARPAFQRALAAQLADFAAND